MTKYFQFLEKSIAVSPVGVTDQTKTFRDYVERNVAASFEFSDKLLRAKDFQDVVRMQTEFFQTQLRALNAQSQALGDKAVMTESEVSTSLYEVRGNQRPHKVMWFWKRH
jgi:hypothetical protein